jgi:energy-coupling factor transporter ATP-binding protein EcfA2
MKPSPQSQEVIEKLLHGDRLSSGDAKVGPLDETGILLLRSIVDNYEILDRLKGEEQSRQLRKFYLDLKKPKESDDVSPIDQKANNEEKTTSSDIPTVDDIGDKLFNPEWRLHSLRSLSVRGIALPGEEFEFRFEGKSNLIFGPNGSGKSSLLSALIWVFTGKVITDSEVQEESASLICANKDSRLCDWPIIVTLPVNPTSSPVDCWAMVHLKSKDNTRNLFLKRSFQKGLVFSEDGETWTNCKELSDYCVSSLDLQLSLITPTVFGRRSIETAEDTRSLLSLMLGFDDLEDIGDLLIKISGNRTKLENTEIEDLRQQWNEIHEKLKMFPERLQDDCKYKDDLARLSKNNAPTCDDIIAVGQNLTTAITLAEESLMTVLGIPVQDGKTPTGIADKLIFAVTHLEQERWNVFPSLASIKIDAVFPSQDTVKAEDQFEELCTKLDGLKTRAISRIKARLEFWRKEIEPGSKLPLLIKAAQIFDSTKNNCPVCDQSIKQLPLKDELVSLKDLDFELAKDVHTLFVELEKELSELLPPTFRIET